MPTQMRTTFASLFIPRPDKSTGENPRTFAYRTSHQNKSLVLISAEVGAFRLDALGGDLEYRAQLLPLVSPWPWK